MIKNLNLTSRAASQSNYISRNALSLSERAILNLLKTRKFLSYILLSAASHASYFTEKLFSIRKEHILTLPMARGPSCSPLRPQASALVTPVSCPCSPLSLSSDPHHSRLLWLSALVTSVPSLSCLINVSPLCGVIPVSALKYVGLSFILKWESFLLDHFQPLASFFCCLKS